MRDFYGGEMRAPGWFLVAVIMVAATACGESSSGVALCAAADVERCLVTQRSCELTAGTPACVACDSGQHPGADGACAPIRGTALAHDFPEHTVASGTEVLGQCRSWTLNNDEDLWVAGVELAQNEAYTLSLHDALPI